MYLDAERVVLVMYLAGQYKVRHFKRTRLSDGTKPLRISVHLQHSSSLQSAPRPAAHSRPPCRTMNQRYILLQD